MPLTESPTEPKPIAPTGEIDAEEVSQVLKNKKVSNPPMKDNRQHPVSTRRFSRKFGELPAVG